MKTRFKACAIATKYWRPGEDYLREIVEGVAGKIRDGDYLVVSEKAISLALGNIIDESKAQPSLNAKIIAKLWMPIVWGYVLGPLCHLKPKLMRQLRDYPRDAGSRHKQVVLQYAGLLQALMFGSEGGIDGTNLPYEYVALPLKNAQAKAEEIRSKIFEALGKNVCVIIADTDKTYSFRNFHFTPRPKPIKGIHSFGGFIAYVIGRMLKLKRRATPIAVAGRPLSAEEALKIAELANRARGFGAGRTVWEMAEKFKVGLAEVSWEMLEAVKHKPIVIVRPINHRTGT
ncbi:MAG: coenzyme F420-0:L-glutamate ligase [Candidatus Bathyarchaeota archaeon]|nr:coenzyme F420-0:L-glutamate ligase [Candidatus Bathyarchaeota archaeon]MDW8040758.1 coenzyme F420-0:L-glutamate ligase [Nitrososphaerota archaeon]